jgi:hypothetical protein
VLLRTDPPHASALARALAGVKSVRSARKEQPTIHVVIDPPDIAP